MIKETKLPATPAVASTDWLCVNVTSMVVGGEKLEGEKLIAFIEAMSERDRRSMIEDMGVLEMLGKKFPKYSGPTPCSHCGGNGYEP